MVRQKGHSQHSAIPFKVLYKQGIIKLLILKYFRRHKINFYINISVFKIVFFLLPILFVNILSAQNNYFMNIANGSYISENEFEFNVSLYSTGSDIEFTAFQCAMDLEFSDGNYDNLEFRFIAGSSGYSIFPSHFTMSTDSSRNFATLVFASQPGSDIITSEEKSVGTFIVKRSKKFNAVRSTLNWNFQGTFNTILMGASFINITDSASHVSNFSILSTKIMVIKKLDIVSVSASSTLERSLTAFNTIDGLGYYSGNQNSKWKAKYKPASLIFDLGLKKSIYKTRFSFENFEIGKLYKYSVHTSLSQESWNSIIPEVYSEAKEWSEQRFVPVVGRYVKLIFINDSANLGLIPGLWEAEIWGTSTDKILTGVTEDEVPKNFELYQNYPNPFNPTTTIRFELEKEGHVKLEVYSMLGEKLLVLLDKRISRGKHEVFVDASNLPSGVYIYRINFNNIFVKAKKMTLLK